MKPEDTKAAPRDGWRRAQRPPAHHQLRTAAHLVIPDAEAMGLTASVLADDSGAVILLSDRQWIHLQQTPTEVQVTACLRTSIHRQLCGAVLARLQEAFATRPPGMN